MEILFLHLVHNLQYWKGLWQQTEEVLNLINSLRDRGKTVIVISHNLSQVFEVADQISVMYQGNMVGTRRTKETTRQEIVSMIVGFEADAEAFV